MEAADNGPIVLTHTSKCFAGSEFSRSYSDFHRGGWRFPYENSLTKILSILYAALLFALLPTVVSGLGSMGTLGLGYGGDGNALVCGIMQGNVQSVQCWSSNGSLANLSPSQVSYLGVSAGKGFVCAVRADTGRPLCWNASAFSVPKRLKNDPFIDIVSGNSQVCALSQLPAQTGNGSFATCWRNGTIEAATPTQQAFTTLASGGNFVCGIRFSDGTVQCWGDSLVSESPNATFFSIQAGLSHACGITNSFNVQCWGDNTYGQLQVPQGEQFLSLALGERHSCGIEAFTRNVICWGDSSSFRTSSPANLSFVTISAGDSYTCGISYENSSIICWGVPFGNGTWIPLGATTPSTCTRLACDSSSFQQSNASGSSRGLCSGSQLHICTPCRIGCQSGFIQTSQCTADHDITCSPTLNAPPLSSPPPSATQTAVNVITTNSLSKGFKVLIAFGAAGVLFGILTIGWCVWAKCCGPVGLTFDGSQGRVHNSSVGTEEVLSTPVSVKRQRSATSIMRRQRSSTSSVRSRGDITTRRAQAFTTADMAAATMNFSEQNMIATGSFGTVYKGMLGDGREVAVKRREKEMVMNEKKMDDRESAFESELEFLSRLHHKHLVSLVGFCDEDDERMLVYEYMPNGTLHDHLHGTGQAEGGNGVLPWPLRVKIALEAARGVEYLHTYALPPIIHRDIKSSNILLDGGWNARVSDFGLSTRGPADDSHISLMAAGTLGYMDPEYYRLQHLTTKSDVYSFGVVLLELLTGERAIHKQSHGPVNIVDHAVPRIVNQDLASVLDQRPGVPSASELRALEMIAQLAAQCVKLEGRERPTMTQTVAVLEEAMALTSNWRNRSVSSTIASLSGIPFAANITPFDPLDETSDAMAVPFENLQFEAAPLKVSESEAQHVILEPFFNDKQRPVLMESVSSVRWENIRLAGSNTGENELLQPFPDVLSASERGTGPVDTVSETTYGGSGRGESSEPLEILTSFVHDGRHSLQR